ncbi:MAG TPA: hypothetical protein PK341_12655 [Spirochaetota bacterium]|nr:hypothetical protein [Spirochaetota bacterium]
MGRFDRLNDRRFDRLNDRRFDRLNDRRFGAMVISICCCAATR